MTWLSERMHIAMHLSAYRYLGQISVGISLHIAILRYLKNAYAMHFEYTGYIEVYIYDIFRAYNNKQTGDRGWFEKVYTQPMLLYAWYM